MDPIIHFYTDRGANQSGRTRKAILGLTNSWLENEHDWIQWLFPLPEPSLAVPESPILTPVAFALFQNNIIARAHYWQSVERMCRFFNEEDYWLRYTDHNHKRITRIIRSMKIVLNLDEASRFWEFIMDIEEAAGSPVSAINKEFWLKEIDE